MKKSLITGLITGLLIAVLAFIGGCIPADDSQEGSTGTIYLIVLVVLMGAMIYFVMIRPQKKRQKEHETLMQELQRGDRVITAGGIYGTIESISEDSVVIKVESGQTLRVARGSVMGRREK